MGQNDDSFFCAFSPAQFVLAATVLGLLLTNGMDIDEQNSLGNFLATIGQVLQTTASQSEFLETKCKSNKKIQEKINELKQQISDLEKEISGR